MDINLLPVINGSNDVDIPAASIVKGKEQALPNTVVHLHYPLNGTVQATLWATSPQGARLNQVANSPTIGRDHILKLMSFVGGTNSFMTTTYAQAWSNAAWRAFYGLSDGVNSTTPVAYKSNNGYQIVQVQKGGPCHDCKMLLPETHLTIDHQRPQAGGAVEAVCKVFRAGGLTKGGPKGTKGTNIVASWAAQLGGTQANYTSRDDSYTLNDAGTIHLSMVVAANALADLKVACMHHLVNLRPLCHACNSPNRSLVKYP